MSKIAIIITTILIALGSIPFALAAMARAVPSSHTRIHIIQDMDNQPKFRAQHANPLFADGRAMRPVVAGTVAQGQLEADDHYNRGVVDNDWATTFPPQVQVNLDLVYRGQDRFNIYCTPCHGYAGYGDGMINQRAMDLVNLGLNGTTWVQPKNMHEQLIREQPVGQTFNTITNGVRNMSGYAAQIPTEDRWAIVAYVKALQRSQAADLNDLPPDQRNDLQVIKLHPETP
ncbi:MAG: cytochrome c [Planctomycetes bacterium]|nr:cytochrome c [Planctomycetota bacterium]